MEFEAVLDLLGISEADITIQQQFPSRSSVQDSYEFKRVKNLPRRNWKDNNLADKLTAYLKTPEGTQKLRPVQAAALKEAYEMGGVLGPIRVGKGKTLITALVATLLKSKRPMLVIPAKLREKTLRDFAELKKHWKIKDIEIVSYTLLGIVSGAEILDKYKPDLLILDECQKLKNPRAACTRRVARYIRNQDIKPKVIALSGTITNRSIRDFWHILLWCSPNHPPLPKRWPQILEWSRAVDEGQVMPLKPGVLTQFCKENENVKQGLGRRITETPGVVATKEDELGVSLLIEEVKLKLPEKLQKALIKMRATWETPSGLPFEEATQLWRHARELGCGFWYEWTEQPPKEWLFARKEWSKYVRDSLKHSKKLDSPLQIAKASQQLDIYKRWKDVKNSFKPVTAPNWIDDFVIDYVIKWLEQNPEGIAWTEHVAVGQRIADKSNFPYFNDNSIEIYEGPCIASIPSVGEGLNLQKWNKNLITSCLPNGKIWEQLIGRTHRDGQKADEVSVEIIFTIKEAYKGFKRAYKDAKYIQDITNQAQKLCYADMNVSYPANLLGE